MGNKYVFVDWNDIDPGYGVSLSGYFPPNAAPYGIKIVAHTPEIDGEPVIKKDKPWEKTRVGAFASIIKIGDTYHCWYDAIGPRIALCYATSKDGVNWEKPSLGLVEYPAGNKDTNIINFNDVPNIVDEGWVVIYQEDAPDDEKFKMMFTRVDYTSGNGHTVWIHGAVSSDGIHWNEIGPLFEGGDCQTSLVYDKKNKKYRVITKAQDPENLARRTMFYIESDDFRGPYTGRRYILHGSLMDPPDDDIYGVAYHEWLGTDNAHVIFPQLFHRNWDCVDLTMAVSRDLYTWNYAHKQLVPGIWKRYSNYSDVGLTIDEKGRWVHYYCALGGGHNGHKQYADREVGGIRRMIFRPDGYTSLRAESTGEFTTLPHKLGKSMVINADIPFFSSIKIAITIPHTNEPAEGFSWEDCQLVPIDEYRYEVKWARPLSELDGAYRLRVKMYRADLYSYTLDCEEDELKAEHFYKLDKPAKTE